MIWLIGCKGMLGREVAKQLDKNKLYWMGTDKEVDITNYEALRLFTKEIETNASFPSKIPHKDRKVTWVVNCAAYTDVEKAENEPEIAEKINSYGPTNIARLCREIGCKLIHISTDYVFGQNGNSPFLETSEKNPLGVYGKTKHDGDISVQKEMNQYYIFRTSWLYGYEGNNFVYKMIDEMNNNTSVRVVNDQKGTPTSAVELAEVIVNLIIKSNKATAFFGKNSAPAYGVYNYTNLGETTWYEYAKEIYRLGKKYGKIQNDCEIIPCSSDEYNSVVLRPKYSVLSKEKIIKEFKIKIPEWEKSLELFIKNKNFNSI